MPKGDVPLIQDDVPRLQDSEVSGNFVTYKMTFQKKELFSRHISNFISNFYGLLIANIYIIISKVDSYAQAREVV